VFHQDIIFEVAAGVEFVEAVVALFPFSITFYLHVKKVGVLNCVD